MSEEKGREDAVVEIIVPAVNAASSTEIKLLGKVDPDMIGRTAEFQIDTGGRRDSDAQTILVAFERKLHDAFFWIFGMFLETKAPHKPSISRVSWWMMVCTGVAMFVHEMLLTQCAKVPALNTATSEGARRALQWAHELGHCGVPISNAAWQAWATAFGACSVAVLGPKAVEFWKAGAATSLGTIATAARDKIDLSKEPSPRDDETRDRAD